MNESELSADGGDDRLEGVLRAAVDHVLRDAPPEDALRKSVERAAALRPAPAAAAAVSSAQDRRHLLWAIAASVALLASLVALDQATEPGRRLAESSARLSVTVSNGADRSEPGDTDDVTLFTDGEAGHGSKVNINTVLDQKHLPVGASDIGLYETGGAVMVNGGRSARAARTEGWEKPNPQSNPTPRPTPAAATPSNQNFAALTDLITSTVSPQSWDDKYGYRSTSKGYHGPLPTAAGKMHPGPGVDGPGPGVMMGEAAPVRLSVVDDVSDRFMLTQNGDAARWDVDADGLTDRGWFDFSQAQHHTENYARIHDNRFLAVRDNPLSTFSIDVDTASYSNVRRFLTQEELPPPDAVRIEELVNYFPYDYAPPQGDAPFAVHPEVAGCPWQPAHRLLRVGLKGRVIADEQRNSTNLVFLLDVSGSMDQPNKLPLVKSSLRLLVDRLTENDRVAIVVYAGASGLVQASTPGNRQAELTAALDRLQAGGSTNGGQGIELAYSIAQENFIKGGVNRVILCTDGDFNVGVTSDGDLTRLIEDKAKSGVFLSVLGFGMGNLQDSKLEALADKGNGNYAYIDTEREARKVFVEQLNGTLVTIAKDVKIQIEFNPAKVAAYRLLGYENRMLRAEDFTDDKKDAGEIGAGHTVTALYEIVPVVPAAAQTADTGHVEPLKYQTPAQLTEAAAAGDLLTLKLRYKQPDGDVSTPLEFPVQDAGTAYAAASADYKFAASVAGFGMLLRRSPFAGNLTWDGVKELAEEGRGGDLSGYRAEFLDLVARAKSLQPPPAATVPPPATEPQP